MTEHFNSIDIDISAAQAQHTHNISPAPPRPPSQCRKHRVLRASACSQLVPLAYLSVRGERSCFHRHASTKNGTPSAFRAHPRRERAMATADTKDFMSSRFESLHSHSAMGAVSDPAPPPARMRVLQPQPLCLRMFISVRLAHAGKTERTMRLLATG